jgi:ADP-ribosylglycohydrolase/transcriptional regulator with XRE-family HTH domain
MKSIPIRAAKPGGTARVTIRDVAEKAGVSPAAVSLTLSGRGRIADDTRRHILAVAAALNYTPPRRKPNTADMRELTVHSGIGTEYHAIRIIDAERQIALLRDEYEQRRQEGYFVAELEPLVEKLDAARLTVNEIELLWNRLEYLEAAPDYPFVEPSAWAEIAAECPPSAALKTGFSAQGLYDRIYGGWLGRAAGCTLGRPLELVMNFEEIEEFLERGGTYPLDDYVPEILPRPTKYAAFEPDIRQYLRGHIEWAPRDDDLDYTLLNLMVLEKYGQHFTSEQVAQTWLQHLAFNSTYTAERIAYANLVSQFGPPDTAIYRNPYREFIGAQIRADIFGYTSPGQPARAALLAWRDARISHVKNGLYGAMLVSAMIAAAFVTSDIESIVEIGLASIPARSRMATAVRETMDQTRNSGDWRDVAAYITERYADYDSVHVLPNACIVVLALLWGKGDFERSITTAAMCGMDTDCNAATVGSIMGVVCGAASLPDKWTAPLNDHLKSWVRGHAENRLSDLAQRTLNVARQMMG